MVCPLLKKGNCKKQEKPCSQKYSVKMINHKDCSIFAGGKVVAVKTKAIKVKKSEVKKAKKAKKR